MSTSPTLSTSHLAQTTDFAFVEELLTYGEGYAPQPGDTVEFQADDIKTTSGEPFPADHATVVSRGDETMVLRDDTTGQDIEVQSDGWFTIMKSPAISALWERHLRRPCTDGVAFADGLVPAELVSRLRADVQRLVELEPVDYHPGSGTRVRDLVHPSLYPYIKGRSVRSKEAPADEAETEAPEYDRFGRPYEGSDYQWLPTPFHIAADGFGDLGARFVELNADGRTDVVYHRWIDAATQQAGAYLNIP